MAQIPYKTEYIKPAAMLLGLVKDRSRGMKVSFEHRPYEKRTPADRHDYDRLEMDILKHGIRKPLIGWRNPDTGFVHILVGQRRAEIAKKHHWAGTLAVCVIQEDVREWWKDVYDRLPALKAEIGEVPY